MVQTTATDGHAKAGPKRWLLDALSKELGTQLTSKEFELDDGWFEIDGYSDDPSVLCEVWANFGLPKNAQRGKIMTDAFKMLFTNTLLEVEARCILLFADKRAAAPFQGKTWMAECLKAHEIEVTIIEPPPQMQVQKRRRRPRTPQ